ncbi:MAG: hypothetical protein MMC23_009436 [Stictis urceolatum]|nr:hypothetical protein [Stictis urceolata]
MALSKRFILLIVSAIVLVALSGLFGSRPDLRDGVRSQISSYKVSFYSQHSMNDALRQKIWQTSKNDSKNLDHALRENVMKWHSLNPQWQYEMLDDNACLRYVQRRFEESDPEIVDVFTQLQDKIMRADLFRYLVLLGDGGVYSDMDTECLKPIADWIPPKYRNLTHAVLGVEYDTYGQGRGMALLDLQVNFPSPCRIQRALGWLECMTDIQQLANWTLLARKGHGLMKLTVKRAVDAIVELARSQNTQVGHIKPTFNDVLASTGPARLTVATWEYLSHELGEDFGWHNVSGLKEPMLVADVLLLPVTSFGNGQSHSFAKPPTDQDALVHHQFRGDWKTGTHAYGNMAEEQKHEPEMAGASNHG